MSPCRHEQVQAYASDQAGVLRCALCGEKFNLGGTGFTLREVLHDPEGFMAGVREKERIREQGIIPRRTFRLDET